MALDFLEVTNVTKRYGGKLVLDDVSFCVSDSEILTITGDNGAGKSTLLSILATLEKPSEGHVFLEGRDIVRYSSEVRRDISYVPQEICLHPQLPLWDNLKFWAAMSGLGRKERGEAHERILTLLNLEPYLKTKVIKLSGGIQRRANIAAALYNKPKLLLMDEPTAGVDFETRRRILDFVVTMRDMGASVLYVTHLADEIAFFQQGKLAADNKRLNLLGGCVGFLGKAVDCPECHL